MPIIGCNDLAKAGSNQNQTERALYRISGTGATYVAQAGDTVDLAAAYLDSTGGSTARLGLARVSDGVVLHEVDIVPSASDPAWAEQATSFDLGAIAGTEVQLFQTFFATGDPLASPFMPGPVLVNDTVHKGQRSQPIVFGMQDNTTWSDYSSAKLAYFNVTSASSTPTITDIDGDESVYPGQSFVITGTNFGATQGSGAVDIDGVTQTVTAWGDTSITCTAVRGGNEYGTGKTLTVTTDAATTATLGVAQEAEPGTFAVTAASPNTTDDASLWTGLIDTATSNPVTVVDGDQAWVKDPNNLGNLSVTPSGEISADTEGDFFVQFWKLSEGVWGSDQTVSFTLPDVIGGTIPRMIGVRSAVRSAVTRSAHSPVYRRA